MKTTHTVVLRETGIEISVTEVAPNYLNLGGIVTGTTSQGAVVTGQIDYFTTEV
jgi:hypothetical protein